MKDLHIRPEIIKLLGKNLGSKHLDIRLGNDFFWTWHQMQRQQQQKVGLHKTKIFCTEKETKEQLIEQEKIRANHI